jgi:hypothetical protein
MSNTPVKVAVALFMVLAMPAASFARGGGAPGVGSVATGHFGASRLNGVAMGTLDPGLNPSQSLPKTASIPPPRISVPTVPQFK